MMFPLPGILSTVFCLLVTAIDINQKCGKCLSPVRGQDERAAREHGPTIHESLALYR